MEASTVLVLMMLAVIPTVSFARPARSEKFIDLSHVYDETTIGWLTATPFNLMVPFNGTTESGNWLQLEDISTGTHVGTHIDAPCHMARGRWTLEQIPLKHLVAPAAVVDITWRAETDPNALLHVSDLLRWEQQSGQSLNRTIVLVRTGWDRRWPDPTAYVGNAERDTSRMRYPGVSGEAAQWLVQRRRIYGLGIDTLSLDNGVNSESALPAHMNLLGANIYGMENVARLHLLPEFGAQLHVSPMRLGQGACGSPVRIIAVLP